MRVCLFTETFHPVMGGGETQARLLAEEMTAQGFGTFVMRLVRLGREMHPPGGGAGGSDGSSPSGGSGTRS